MDQVSHPGTAESFWTTQTEKQSLWYRLVCWDHQASDSDQLFTSKLLFFIKLKLKFPIYLICFVQNNKKLFLFALFLQLLDEGCH